MEQKHRGGFLLHYMDIFAVRTTWREAKRKRKIKENKERRKSLKKLVGFEKARVSPPPDISTKTAAPLPPAD